MARHAFMRRGGTLVPTTPDAEQALRAVRDGREVMVALRPPRNIKHHRLLFAMLNFVIEHSDTFENKDLALIGLKIACGLVDPYIDPGTGKTFFVPRSIAFESMSQDEFNGFFDRACFVVAERWMPSGTTPESVRAEILAMIEPRSAA